MRKSKLILLALIALAIPCRVFCGEADSAYSVKHRWVVKASGSAYRCMLRDIPTPCVGDNENSVNDLGLNMRFECSYAFSKNMEIGLFAGFQCHKYGYFEDNGLEEQIFGKIKTAVSPVFGVNLHFQLLPLFLKTASCRWDLYLTANYAGCLMKHYYELESSLYPFPIKYRHTYGVGFGLAYYFKNRVGLFGELCVGNYSLFPDYLTKNINFRGGIAAKF